MATSTLSKPTRHNDVISPSASPGWARLPMICTALILIYSIVLAVFSLKGFPTSLHLPGYMPFLCIRPVGEDAFYMLTVAWNMAAGHGVSYNYGVPTTGIQPLSTVIYAGLAYVVQHLGGDKWTLVRVVIVCDSLMVVLFAYLVRCITLRMAGSFMPTNASVKRYAAVLSFVLAALSPTVFKIFTYGLETSFYLVLIAAAILVSFRLAEDRPDRLKTLVLLGVLCGLAAEARIDFGVVLAVALVLFVCKRILSFREACLVSVLTLLLVSPWFLYVRSVSGHWMPSSGGAESVAVGQLNPIFVRVVKGVTAVLGTLNPMIYTGYGVRWAVPAGLMLIFALVFAHRRKAIRPVLNQPAFGVWKLWFIAFCPLVVVYVIHFWAWYFYIRYFLPLSLLAIPILSLMLSAAIGSSKTARYLLVVAQAVAFVGFTVPELHLTGPNPGTHALGAEFISKPMYSNRVVAAFQSGTLGYFCDNVMNLDGKLDYDALEYVKRHRIDQYIDRENVEYLTDWSQILYQMIGSDYLNRNFVKLDEQPLGGKWVVYRRIKR